MLSAFSRETSSGSFIAEVDGLRFLAISAVMLYHVANYVRYKPDHPVSSLPGQDWLYRIFNQGFIGVQAFFVISAFVVAMPFARHWLGNAPPPRLSYYFTRRLTRLEPPYFIHLLILFAVLVLASHHAPAPLLRHLAASVFYAHHLIYGRPDLEMNWGLWSLEIEVQFYVLAPLFTLVFRLRPKWFRRAVLLSGIVASAVCQKYLPGSRLGDGAARWNLLYEMHYFLAGFLLVDFYLTEFGRAAAFPYLWDLLTTVSFAAIPLAVAWDHGTVSHLALALLMLGAYVGVFRGRLCAVWRRPRPFSPSGECAIPSTSIMGLSWPL